MTEAEFCRPVRIDTVGEQPRTMHIAAEPEERAALAARFGLIALDRLEAELSLSRNGDEVAVHGTLQVEVIQACIASGAPVPTTLAAPFDILFRPQPGADDAGEEIELSEGDLDVVFYESGDIDLGEAVAETLALSLDPWPRSPEAEAILREAGVKPEGEEEKGPFAALGALKDKLTK